MKYFTIRELAASATARKLGIDNTPPLQAEANLRRLVENVLDPLREAWGKPLAVSSGYRSPKLNKAVGGVATSQHMEGNAADINTGNRADNRRLFMLAIDLGLPFDQIIDENNFAWVHISHDPSRNRRQALRL